MNTTPDPTTRKNPAFGKWTEEETNWSQADTEFIKDVIDEKPVPITYKEILDVYESKLTA